MSYKSLVSKYKLLTLKLCEMTIEEIKSKEGLSMVNDLLEVRNKMIAMQKAISRSTKDSNKYN